jgi:hypothetical protein
MQLRVAVSLNTLFELSYIPIRLSQQTFVHNMNGLKQQIQGINALMQTTFNQCFAFMSSSII